MPNNYVLLEKITVGAAGAASVTFANIPQTGYTDLVVKTSARTSASDQNIKVTFNGSSSSYSERWLYGSGSVTGSGSATTNGYFYIHYATNSGDTASTFGNSEIYIPNYTSSNFKSISEDAIQENNATAAFSALGAGLWSNTAAITTIALTPLSGNFNQNSTFYLYGVAKLGTTPAIAPKAAGGDIVDTDGTYWYHTFLSSGTFTPAVALTTDYLVVAGGGGGGGNIGGGGGAGGYRTAAGFSCASGTALTVTVGAGGAGGSGGASGSTGSNSVFSTITSAGGGFGAYFNILTGGGAGGSGGGAGARNANPGGAASPAGQGFAGGASDVGSNVGGGGGGASAVGTTVTGTGTAANGGAGLASSISGTSITYAGGGGGGSFSPCNSSAGGAGGGGAANTTDAGNGSNGTANRGGGGGGAGFTGTPIGGSGGSGIVIIRYPVAS